jgi:phytoene desaturase
MPKAIIIGAGIGGIATAIRLRAKGYDVEVFEQQPYAGGKLTAFEQNGYRFDAGPSLFTMPWLVDELFQLAGKDPKDYFTYQQQEIACRYFWDDRTELTAWGNPERFATAVAETFHVPEQTVLRHLQWAARTYNATGKIFLERPLHKAGTWFSRDVMHALLRVHTYALNSTMHRKHVAAVGDPKLVQLFDRFATYNGSDPYKAPAMLSMIPHLEHNTGTYFPEGGMHAISQSLYRLSLELGVTYRFESPVDRIIVDGNRATGIESGGEKITSQLVVSNVDVWHTYHRLAPQLPKPEKTLKQERSSSAIIFYWGMRQSFPELDLHNIFFSNGYRAEFEAMFNDGTMYHDPTVYVHISSKANTVDAPDGCTNWFVLVNAPADVGQNWDELIAQTRLRVLDKVGKLLGVALEPLIDVEQVLDPRTIASRTGSYAGSLYGSSSNNRWAAFLRHRNQHRQVRNLYFVGGSVHPGGGIPLCLNGARITANLVPTVK